MFTQQDYDRLHDLVFRSDYSGYKPNVVELPNGDGKADTEKRYAHVATKYLKTAEQRATLLSYLETAHSVALDVAEAIGLPGIWWPNIEYGALRVLEYPPGATSALHEDFDLFTLMCYRDQPDKFKAAHVQSAALDIAQRLNPQAHIGEIGTILGLGPSTTHWVEPSDTTQHSIVYFAIPDHKAMLLPGGVTVGDWLTERLSRSRTYK